MKPVFLTVGESGYIQGKVEYQKQPCCAELEASAKGHAFQVSSLELCADCSWNAFMAACHRSGRINDA